jgi:protein-tyrosine-phosphatase
MEKGQKEALQIEFPGISERVYTVSEMVGDDFDIRDPIGGPLVDFQETADELERILKEGYSKITQLAKESD